MGGGTLLLELLSSRGAAEDLDDEEDEDDKEFTRGADEGMESRAEEEKHWM